MLSFVVSRETGVVAALPVAGVAPPPPPTPAPPLPLPPDPADVSSSSLIICFLLLLPSTDGEITAIHRTMAWPTDHQQHQMKMKRAVMIKGKSASLLLVFILSLHLSGFYGKV